MKQIKENFVQFGDHDENTVNQMRRCLEQGGVYGVLLGDGHYGYSHPIGGVVSYKDRVSISGVGFDIGCGNLALKTDAKLYDVRRGIKDILTEIQAKVSFGIGLNSPEPVEHHLFKDSIWGSQPWKDLLPMAEMQLGTVGGGNHYVDIFVDEAEAIWIGVHFGSRGLGFKTAKFFLTAVGGKDGMDTPPSILDVNSEIGRDYLHGMHLAGRYATAGREHVAYTVAKILKAEVTDVVHNHHNFAWLEQHFGEAFWVVRKGATPAFPGQRGFVGGSMGDLAYIIHGVESMDSKKALYSTVHGAGRKMGRNEAKRTLDKRDVQAWLNRAKVIVLGGGLDEAPQAYKRIERVIEGQGETIAVEHTLKPLGVVMAGKKEHDPYKD